VLPLSVTNRFSLIISVDKIVYVLLLLLLLVLLLRQEYFPKGFTTALISQFRMLPSNKVRYTTTQRIMLSEQ
jgi:hypothetical protein